jgi:uncharacterized SAM-binding protein YcdF (DUF218 family)
MQCNRLLTEKDRIQGVSYLEPALPVLLLLSLAGLARAWRRSKPGNRPWLLAIGVTGTLLLSMNAVAWILSRPLETWYEDGPLPHESAEAIVILAGTVHTPSLNRPYTFATQDTYQRLQHGVFLFKHWKPLPILVCGGPLNGQAQSATMQHVLESESVPSELIWIEDRSRSTHENAEYGSQILRQRGISRIALVVEANSMVRAAASFRKAGITVIPAPIRFTTLDFSIMDILPNWRALALNDETIHELVGLAWYRLRGWI